MCSTYTGVFEVPAIKVLTLMNIPRWNDVA